MSAERCPNCDRDLATEPFAPGCHVARVAQRLEVYTSRAAWVAGQIETSHTLAYARAECGAHRVDWRARALRAEAELRAAIVAGPRVLPS